MEKIWIQEGGRYKNMNFKFNIYPWYYLKWIVQEENKDFAEEFVTEAFVEEDGYAVYCCAIVHDAARGLPDFLEYMSDQHANLPVKHGIIGQQKEIETTTISVREFFNGPTTKRGGGMAKLLI